MSKAEINTKDTEQSAPQKWLGFSRGLYFYQPERAALQVYLNLVEEPSSSPYPETKNIPKGTIMGDMHFAPMGSRFIPKHRSFVIGEWLNAFTTFFADIPKKETKLEYLCGHTNERMAKFMRSFGFQTIPNPNAMGQFDAFFVLGKVEDVRKAFFERKTKTSLSKLSARIARQNPK